MKKLLLTALAAICLAGCEPSGSISKSDLNTNIPGVGVIRCYHVSRGMSGYDRIYVIDRTQPITVVTPGKTTKTTVIIDGREFAPVETK